MAHEVYQKEDGTLGVRIPETVWNAFDKEEKKDDFVIDTPTKSSEVVVGRNTGDIFKFEADVEFSEGTRTFGVRFMRTRAKQNLTSLYLILQRTVMYSRRNRTGHGQQIRTSDWKDRLI